MLHESNMSRLTFNHDKIADIATQDMVRYKLNKINDTNRNDVSLPNAVYHDLEFDDTLTIEYLRNIMTKNETSTDNLTLFAQVPSELALEKLCENNSNADSLREFNNRLRGDFEALTYGTPIEDDICTNLGKVFKNGMITV